MPWQKELLLVGAVRDIVGGVLELVEHGDAEITPAEVTCKVAPAPQEEFATAAATPLAGYAVYVYEGAVTVPTLVAPFRQPIKFTSAVPPSVLP